MESLLGLAVIVFLLAYYAYLGYLVALLLNIICICIDRKNVLTSKKFLKKYTIISFPIVMVYGLTISALPVFGIELKYSLPYIHLGAIYMELIIASAVIIPIHKILHHYLLPRNNTK